jgi:hypothetical protein
MKRFACWVVAISAVLVLPAAARALEAKAVLDKLGFPADAQTKVLGGEYVETSLPTTSERDLNVGIAFLVKTSPQDLGRKLREDMVLQRVDPGTIAYGKFEGDGSIAQLAGLKLTPAQLKAFSRAKPGDDLNLSSEEIAALNAVGKDVGAIQNEVRELLLARYRAYQVKGIAGIAPYARKGSKSDPAGDLIKVDRSVRASGILPAEFYGLLESYPQGASSDLAENHYWAQFKAHGEDTIALVHDFQGTFAGTLVAVQRQYYVSTGYNAEQAIVGFLPVKDGTLVIYTNHTSTDQLTGFGGSAKRGIGRRLMARELEKLFKRTSAAVTTP